MEISHVLETCIYASDLNAAERFYGSVLGLKKMGGEMPRHVFFHVSETSVLLVFNPAETIKEQEVPSHGAKGPGHVAFAISHEDLPAWRERLTNEGVAIERELEWPNGARSIYFRDPAGNSVELVTPEIWGTQT